MPGVPPLAILLTGENYGILMFQLCLNQGIADMELPDNLLAELEILENITSCNKVLISDY